MTAGAGPCSPVGRGGPQSIPRPPGACRGPGAWWAQPGAVVGDRIGLEQVRSVFLGRRGGSGEPRGVAARGSGGVVRVELPSWGSRPAAVLCVLFEEAGQARVVLTRRSARLRSHTGEVSFPGGRLDPGESAVEAALREAQEEVGLDPSDVEILGELRSLSTWSSRASIRPFVGVLERRPVLVANADEVDRVFTVALGDLMAPGVYHEERWPADGAGYEDPGSSVHFFELYGETVWGATARMLRDLLDLVVAPAEPN